MIRRFLSLVAVLAISPALSQDVALQPRSYSPTEDLPIEVVSVAPSGSHNTRITVRVGNRTETPKTVHVACSLYADDGSPMTSGDFYISMIPPGSEAVDWTPVQARDVAKAFCRITSFRDEG